MNVTLPPELERLVEAKLRTGLYSSVTEVVSDALRRMDHVDDGEANRLRDLRQRMDKALRECDEGGETDGEQFMQAMLDELDGLPLSRRE